MNYYRMACHGITSICDSCFFSLCMCAAHIITKMPFGGAHSVCVSTWIMRAVGSCPWEMWDVKCAGNIIRPLLLSFSSFFCIIIYSFFVFFYLVPALPSYACFFPSSSEWKQLQTNVKTSFKERIICIIFFYYVRFTLNCSFPFKKRRTHTRIWRYIIFALLLLGCWWVWLLFFISCDRLDSVDSNEMACSLEKHRRIYSIQFKLKSFHISKFVSRGPERRAREKEIETRSNGVGREIHGKWIFRYFSLSPGMRSARQAKRVEKMPTSPQYTQISHSNHTGCVRVRGSLEFFSVMHGIVVDNLYRSRYANGIQTSEISFVLHSYIFLFTKLIKFETENAAHQYQYWPNRWWGWCWCRRQRHDSSKS